MDPEQDRRRLFHALAGALQQLARTQPLLLVFEDVHWSDDATLDLVLHLARSAAAQRFTLALSYRSDEVGPRLARLLAELDRTRLASEVELTPLPADDVARMLRAIFGDAGVPGEPFVSALYGVTEAAIRRRPEGSSRCDCAFPTATGSRRTRTPPTRM